MNFFKKKFFFFLLCSFYVSVIQAEKIVIIGDSLSDDGKFGKTLAQSLSLNGNTVSSFAVSNSNFKSWTDGDFSCCKVGFHQRSFQNGNIDKAHTSNGDQAPNAWALPNLLKKDSRFCSEPGMPVDRLIVQQGTNQIKNLTLAQHKDYIEKIIMQACRENVRNVSFVLPPQNMDQNMSAVNKAYADIIKEMSDAREMYITENCPRGVKVTYFPSADLVPIHQFFVYKSKKTGELVQDKVHFWDLPGETAWFNALWSWSKRGYPSPIEKIRARSEPVIASKVKKPH